jgi:hypothetical protein
MVAQADAGFRGQSVKKRLKTARRWLSRHGKSVAIAAGAVLSGLGLFLQGVAALLH